jgi:hypothetical protein
MTKGTQTGVENTILNIDANALRLNRVYKQWKPEWQYVENQLWQGFKGLVDKSAVATWAAKTFVGQDNVESGMREYGAFVGWKRDMQEQINKHIRSMTGAVMNQTEVPRYLAEMATKSDSVHAYQAKIEATLAALADTRKLYEQALRSRSVLPDGTIRPIEEVKAELEEPFARMLEDQIAEIVGETPPSELPPGVRQMP